MTIYKLNQRRGQPNSQHLRFLSKREAINYALYMSRAYGSSLEFEKDLLGVFSVQKIESSIEIDRHLGRAVFLDGTGAPENESTLKTGGYFSVEDIRPYRLHVAA